MTTRFVDTFFYLAILNPNDAAHSRSVELAREIRGRFVTTEWILTEVADALCPPPLRTRLRPLVDQLAADPRTEIVPAASGLFQRGLDLYARRPDKSWSLTDCISFTVMTDRGLHEALTGDHHFEQAGFHALLAKP